MFGVVRFDDMDVRGLFWIGGVLWFWYVVIGSGVIFVVCYFCWCVIGGFIGRENDFVDFL